MNKKSIPQSRPKVHGRTGMAPANKNPERNNALFTDYLNGLGYLQLSFKYVITTQRVAQIIIAVRKERMKAQKEKEKNASK